MTSIRRTERYAVQTPMKRGELPAEVLCSLQNNEQILYVCSHPLLLEQRKKQLMVATGGSIGVRWELLPQLADRILQSEGLAYVRIDQAAREDLVESLLLKLEAKGELVHLGSALRSPGMPKSIALWIEDLEKGLDGASRLWMKVPPNSLLGELWGIYEAYVACVREEEFPYKEARDMYQLAVRLLHQGMGTDVIGCGLVVIEGHFAQTPNEERFMRSIQATAGKVCIPVQESGASDPSVRWLTASTMLREIRHVVADLELSIEEGEDISDCLMVIPNQAYLSNIRRECRAKGLSVKGRQMIPLLYVSEAKRLLAVLRLGQSDWSRSMVVNCAQWYGPSMGLTPDMLAWGHDLISASGVDSYAKEWLGLFYAARSRSEIRLQHLGDGEGDASEVRKRGRYARKWLRLLYKLHQWTSLLTQAGTWTELLSVTLLFSSEDEKLMGSNDNDRRRLAYEKIRQALRARLDMAQALNAGAGDAVTLNRYVQWFQSRMSGLTLSTGREGEGITLCLPEDTYGLSFSRVYVLGLAEDCFPRPFDPHWIWQLVSREIPTASSSVPLQKDQEQVDRMHFHWTIEAAGKLVLSAALGEEKGGLGKASRFVKERFGLPIGKPEDQVNEWFVGDKETEVRDILAAKQGASFLRENSSVSVTGLDLYGKCAFRYFGERILSVREHISRREGLLPLDAGHIVHQVLREMFANDTDTDVEQWLERTDQRLKAALDAHAIRYRLSGGKWEAQRRRLHKEIRHFMAKEYESRSAASLLEWGFGQVHAEKMDEHSIDKPYTLKKDQMEINLTGTIDRIDLKENSFEVVDYKLSASPTHTEIQRGEDLQQALYMLAYHELSQSNHGAGGGRYAVVRDPSSSVSIKFTDEDEFQSFANATKGRVYGLMEQLFQGDVAPVPRHLTVCNHCVLRGVCRRDEKMQDKKGMRV